MMEDWQQHSLEEKVDLEQLLLTPSDSYTKEELNEYSEEIKEESQFQENIDTIANSAQTDIKTEKVELNDREGNAKPFEYSMNGNEEICQICGLEFGNKAVLKIHNSLMHPEGTKDDQINDLDMNNEPVHDRVKQYKCKGSYFPTAIVIETAEKRTLNKHIESNHEGIKPFKCHICTYDTVNKTHLKRHLDSVHERIKPYKCKMCDFEAPQKENLKKHIDSVHERIKPYKCKICDYKTAYKSGLKKHIESVHEGIKPFKCNICDYKAGINIVRLRQ